MQMNSGLNGSLFPTKRKGNNRKAQVFGYRPVSTTPIGTCCRVQTTDALAANYVPPCCVSEVLDELPAPSILGPFFGPRRVFNFLPKRAGTW